MPTDYSYDFIRNVIQQGTYQNTSFNDLLRDNNFLQNTQLYKAAVSILKQSAKTLETNNDTQAMEALLRSHKILTSVEVTSLPSKSRKIFKNVFSEKQHVKQAEKIITSHFEMYLEVKLPSELAHKIQTHTDRIETLTRALGVSPKKWQEIKEDLAADRPNAAQLGWSMILHTIQQKNKYFKSDSEVESFLLGKYPLTRFLTPDNDFTARAFSQFNVIENITSESPPLAKEWLKVQAALLNKDKSFGRKLRHLLKQLPNQDIYTIIFHPQKAAKITNDTVPLRKDNNAHYDYWNLINSLHNFFTSAVNNNIQTLHLPRAAGIDLSTIALDNKVYIATAAPQKNNVDHYFDALEANDTRLVVDLKDDFEKEMNRFKLLPANEGQTVTYGRTQIKLTKKEEVDIPHTFDDTAYITKSTVEITRNGKTREYQFINLHHWQKNDPPDVRALMFLNDQVEAAKLVYGERIAAQCTDGHKRTGAFLLYHHFQNSNTKDAIKNYVEYAQNRPGPTHEQFAAVIAAVGEVEREATAKKNYASEIRSNGQESAVESDSDQHLLFVDANLPFSNPTYPMENRSFRTKQNITSIFLRKADLLEPFKALLDASQDNRKKLQRILGTKSNETKSLADDLVARHLSHFFEDVPKGEITQILNKLKGMNSKELNFLLYLAISGKKYIKVQENVRNNLNADLLDVLTSQEKDKLLELYPKYLAFDILDDVITGMLDRNTYTSPFHNELSKLRLLYATPSPDLEPHFDKLKLNFLNNFFGHDTSVDLVHLQSLGLNDRHMLDVDLIEKLSPKVIAKLPDNILISFTDSQIKALTEEQLKSLSMTQWRALLRNNQNLPINVIKHAPTELITLNLLAETGPKNALKFLEHHTLKQNLLRNYLAYTIDEKIALSQEQKEFVRWKVMESTIQKDVETINKLCERGYKDGNVDKFFAYPHLFNAMKRIIDLLDRMQTEDDIYRNGAFFTKGLDRIPAGKGLEHLSPLYNIINLLENLTEQKILPTELDVRHAKTMINLLIDHIVKYKTFSSDAYNLIGKLDSWNEELDLGITELENVPSPFAE